jgi:hypothetical protein
MGMHIANDGWLIVPSRYDADGRGLLGRLLPLHRLAVMVELIKDFVKPVIGSASIWPLGAAGIAQDGVQESCWNPRHMQLEAVMQWFQATYGTGSDR